jgi:hypothetical protein
MWQYANVIIRKKPQTIKSGLKSKNEVILLKSAFYIIDTKYKSDIYVIRMKNYSSHKNQPRPAIPALAVYKALL